jgi:uncharacterized protein (DUF2147 family)
MATMGVYISGNNPPMFGMPSPANDSTGNLLNLNWSIPINDPEGDTFSWTIQCSNGQNMSMTGASNGTKFLGLYELADSTSYTVWVNATDPNGSGLYTRIWYVFFTKTNLVNSPPVFGTSSLANGSIVNRLSLLWSIPINDPEGDTFSWTIQCSNGQNMSMTGASNGTKSLVLCKLVNLNCYKVWVNATDPNGSGLYTRRWYFFVTYTNHINNPLVFGEPSPANNSIGNLLSLNWSIPINDPEEDTFSWTIQCSNGQNVSMTGASNGNKSLVLSGLVNSKSYEVWVNASDPAGSGLYTRAWYMFTTKTNQNNNPPVFGTPSPANGSTGQPLSLTWSIPIEDLEGNTFTWSIQCSNGQVINGTDASNGTKSLVLSGLVNLTSYKIWVNATDPTGSGLYTRKWYTFTTKNLANNPPVFGTPSPTNGSTGQPLTLTWSIPIEDLEGNTFTWSIQCSNGQVINGTDASNGTKSLVLSGLANLTSYKIWVNASDPAGSGLYTRARYMFTTKTNQNNNPPVFGTPSPTNGSTGQPLTLTWSIPIEDLEGNTFTWSIQCSNGQVINGTDALNGTKSLVLSGLVNLTSYKVWVNATDPTGSGLYTRKWYTFTTQQQQNLPPNKPNKPSGQTNGKIKQEYSYTTSTTDPDGNQVYYYWDWGDGNYSGWLGPYNSGVSINTTYKWTVKGSYSIKVKAKDIYENESNWSDPLSVTMSRTNTISSNLFYYIHERFPRLFVVFNKIIDMFPILHKLLNRLGQ